MPGQAIRCRCHRLVYDPDYKPTEYPEPVVTSGSRRDGQRRWYLVDACQGHSSELLSRPTGLTRGEASVVREEPDRGGGNPPSIVRDDGHLVGERWDTWTRSEILAAPGYPGGSEASVQTDEALGAYGSGVLPRAGQRLSQAQR